jgi:orotidine-5'-phosphate decarboxylase
MFVVGATIASEMERIRRICPDTFLLVPGVGAQGGSLEEISRYGLTKHGGILINSSRSIIYAGGGNDFANLARDEAQRMQIEMKSLLEKFSFIS